MTEVMTEQDLSVLRRVAKEILEEDDAVFLQEIEDAKNDPRFANTDESRARFLAVLEEIYGIEGDANG